MRTPKELVDSFVVVWNNAYKDISDPQYELLFRLVREARVGMADMSGGRAPTAQKSCVIINCHHPLWAGTGYCHQHLEELGTDEDDE